MRALITPGMATIEALPDRTLRVRVVSGRRGFSWAPGQHVFVRFALSPLHAATTHPFTIANVRGEKAELELVMRVRDGITRALAEKRGKTVRVWVDGPYGHAGLARELQRYDRVLFLAGGSGESSSTSSHRLMTCVQGRRSPFRSSWTSLRASRTPRPSSSSPCARAVSYSLFLVLLSA